MPIKGNIRFEFEEEEEDKKFEDILKEFIVQIIPSLSIIGVDAINNIIIETINKSSSKKEKRVFIIKNSHIAGSPKFEVVLENNITSVEIEDQNMTQPLNIPNPFSRLSEEKNAKKEKRAELSHQVLFWAKLMAGKVDVTKVSYPPDLSLVQEFNSLSEDQRREKFEVLQKEFYSPKL